ncbi:hypothetical protein ASD99_12085 [Mesorhizobium sp. Root695]|uniref:thermonuclease family protein n=1 Tax=Mesorhizobium sp. Root695 TaxID=1736589 RepID=UPI00070CF01D|nr:thermonuclease family protein [Mesorhizobium sp. Root695]KRB14958.1 hypothetical protein ASD99_12085 [Mesorhizobium sp. Root695]
MNRVGIAAFTAPLTLAVVLLAVHRFPAGQTAANVDVTPENQQQQPAAIESTIQGQASVIDGDTLEIHGIRIRLNGIDAPESAQKCEAKGISYRCGQKAAFALDEILADKTVACTKLGIDRYGRTIAKCTVAEVDVSAEMVRRGWATAYRKYSLDYVSFEDVARASGLGIWAGPFENPAKFRLNRKKS